MRDRIAQLTTATRGPALGLGRSIATGLMVALVGGLAFGATVKDKSKVYFGNADSFSKPAVVVAKSAFAEISYYKQIQNEGLKPGDPKYHLLLEKATKVFRKTVEKLSKPRGLDLVVETGYLTLESGETATDMTSTVVNYLKDKN